MLSGDRLALDKVSLGFDLGQTDGVWMIRKLAVASPVVTLDASGSVSSTGDSPTAKLEGNLYLATLAKQLPHAMHIRDGLTLEKGTARIKLDLKTKNGIQQASVDARLSDLVAHDAAKSFTLGDPASITGQASRHASAFSLQVLNVKTGFLDLTASGDLDKGVKLSGAGRLLQARKPVQRAHRLRALKLAGKGRMAGDYQKTAKGFVTRYAIEVKGVNIAGSRPLRSVATTSGLTPQPVARPPRMVCPHLGRICA